MQWMVLPYQADDTFHQGIAAKITQLAQGRARPQMSFAVRVTSRTGQRAFPRDLNRENRGAAHQDLPPRGKEVLWNEAGPGRGRHTWLGAAQGSKVSCRGKES